MFKKLSQILDYIPKLFAVFLCFRLIDSFSFDFEQNINVVLIFISVDNIIVIIMISV